MHPLGIRTGLGLTSDASSQLDEILQAGAAEQAGHVLGRNA